MLKLKNNEITRALGAIKHAFLRLYKEPVFIALFIVLAIASSLTNLLYFILLWLFLICICYGVDQFAHPFSSRKTKVNDDVSKDNQPNQTK